MYIYIYNMAKTRSKISAVVYCEMVSGILQGYSLWVSFQGSVVLGQCLEFKQPAIPRRNPLPPGISHVESAMEHRNFE
jgi:hypothetical protein